MNRYPCRSCDLHGQRGTRLFDIVVKDNTVYFEVKNGKKTATITYTEVQQQVKEAIQKTNNE